MSVLIFLLIFFDFFLLLFNFSFIRLSHQENKDSASGAAAQYENF